MKLVVPTELYENESRVSITPDIVPSLIKMGFKVFVQSNAGLGSSYTDEDYKKSGAAISSKLNELYSKADLVIKVQRPSKHKVTDEFKFLKNCNLITLLYEQKFKTEFSSLRKLNINVFALEKMPRISRAQSMDVLSSQANLAGYRSVIDAAEQFGKAFPMMMTAAGRVNPAKVMVLGVGVAGLQAIATAKRLGAVVSATDVRSATKEQVESLGGKFVMVEDEETTNAETEGGYAKEMSDEYKKKQANLIAETIAKQDIVICTALIPGRTAPVLISKEMVESMATGSVVVDLAVEAGGNCPLSKLGQVVDHNGVKIIGYANVPGRVAKDASALYAKNIFNFLSLIINKDDKKINFNWDDEIINAVVLTNEGELRLEQFN